MPPRGHHRRPFNPAPYSPQSDPVAALKDGGNNWTPLISCPAGFPIELFEIAVSQLVHHPEYNSTLILRSEVVDDVGCDFPVGTPNFAGLQKTRCIHRRLLPRRPGRDADLEQYCTFYTSVLESSSSLSLPEDSAQCPDTLVLTPIITTGSSLPYYHPSVYHIAFRYITSTSTKSDSEPTAMLRIEVLPLPDTPQDPNSRLYRTCLALLETLHRYGWGALTGYRKRIAHDTLIPREEYQDLYLIMRERHKHLIETWQEATDPLKHVFEDIGIATFLMLFWRTTFSKPILEVEHDDPTRPWTSWPRPPAGFLDFGCGNGLLTHILIAEGYQGVGIDVRARISWTHYPTNTQSHLHVHAFDPLSMRSLPSLRRGVFIIGNHADELTPWVPVLATLHNASGYLSIPCCAWSFDSKFERSSTPMFPLPEGLSFGHALPDDNNYNSEAESETTCRIHPGTGLSLDFVEHLNLGGDGTYSSSYSMYRIWLATLSMHCGWEVECETLRIPSTRNWAIVGRKRLTTSEDDARENAQNIVYDIANRGIFKPRKPEGKAGDH